MTVFRTLTAACLSLSLFSFALVEESKKASPQTETFVWRYGTSVLGSLEVPSGFTAETENYREGIVTRLRYPDGSSLLLQKGGLYRVPMFQDPEDILDSSNAEETRTIRRGHYEGSSRCWGEINRAPVKTAASVKSFLALFPPNLGYAHVPRKRADEFFKALESFQPTK